MDVCLSKNAGAHGSYASFFGLRYDQLVDWGAGIVRRGDGGFGRDVSLSGKDGAGADFSTEAIFLAARRSDFCCSLIASDVYPERRRRAVSLRGFVDC
jgi:hypothetical protein